MQFVFVCNFYTLTKFSILSYHLSRNNMIVTLTDAITETLTLPMMSAGKVSAAVLRLDRIHPVVSGNKWFKLKGYLKDAKEKNFKRVVTFGGAYSNHIIATAFAAREEGLSSTGIIRGERPQRLSHTLQQALENNMQLEFLSREKY